MVGVDNDQKGPQMTHGAPSMLSEAELEVIVNHAVEASRLALRSSIGSRAAAYDKADRFMEVFVPALRERLREREAIPV